MTGRHEVGAAGNNFSNNFEMESLSSALACSHMIYMRLRAGYVCIGLRSFHVVVVNNNNVDIDIVMVIM